MVGTAASLVPLLEDATDVQIGAEGALLAWVQVAPESALVYK